MSANPSLNGKDGEQMMSEEPLKSPERPEVRVLGVTRHEIQVLIEEREYTLTGMNLRRLNDFSVTLKLSVSKDGIPRFCLAEMNLARVKSRYDFISEARDLLFLSEDVIKEDLFSLMTVLEKLQRENISRIEEERSESRRTFSLNEGEEAKAIEYLSRKDILTECLLRDTEILGYVGDELAKEVLYLAATSRLLPSPISVLTVSNSSAGKSFAQEKILSLMPDDGVFMYTRISRMSLSHFGRHDLEHKIICVDELSGIEEEALYQVRSLISKGYLMSGYPQVDRPTGQIETLSRRVNGPIAMFTSSTHEDLLDDETRTRFLILTSDETREQTERVMERIIFERTREGLRQDKEKEKIKRKHQVIQKVLRPGKILIPSEWAKTLRMQSERLTARRKFGGYVSLLEAVCLLCQYQKKTETVDGDLYIPLEARDILDANRILGKLFEKESNELSPVNHRMLRDLVSLCKERTKGTELTLSEVVFTRRDIREAAGWEHVPSQRALEALHQMEYVSRAYGAGQTGRWYYRLNIENETEISSRGLRLWSPE